MSEPITRDDLKAHFRRGTEAASRAKVEVTRLTRSRSANRYPGTCPHCGGTVAPGEGVVFRSGEQWVTEHTNGQCPMPVSVSQMPRVQAKSGQTYVGPLMPGIYTLEDNQGGHMTYRVRVQASDADFAPGEAVIEFLSGPNNTADYTPFGFLKPGSLVVWKKFRTEAYRYQVGGAQALLRDPSRAKVSRNCIRCNATLTTPESIEAGIGPTCAGKGW